MFLEKFPRDRSFMRRDLLAAFAIGVALRCRADRVSYLCKDKHTLLSYHTAGDIDLRAAIQQFPLTKKRHELENFAL